MASKIKIDNGPAQIIFEEGVIGSRVKVALKIEQETGAGTGIFTPINLTTYDLAAHIKDNPRNDVTPDFTFTIVKRNQNTEPGWVDLSLDGTVTADMLEKEYQGSLKIWPTGQPEQGDTLAVFTLPMKFRATR